MPRPLANTTLIAATLAAAALVAMPVASVAMFMRSSDIPAARVIANLEARLAKNPKDAEAIYNLGRVHAYLVTFGGTTVPAYSDDATSLSHTADIGHQLSPNAEKAAEHANLAIEALNKAIKLRPADGSYRLALASVCEAAIPLIDRLRTAPMLDVEAVSKDDADAADITIKSLVKPGAEADAAIANATCVHRALMTGVTLEQLRAFTWSLIRARKNATGERLEVLNKALASAWKAEVGEQYFAAFSLAFIPESNQTQRGLRGLYDFVSAQAADAYCRYVPEDQRPHLRRDVIAAANKSFGSLPPCDAITPIIIPMTSPGEASIDSLLAPEARVKFDLDGTGRGCTWSWVKPTTGILVWDPKGTGRITSGRQLFGTATWWMMFDDGYRALDTLDDNRDGRLSDRELTGLALWFDGNANGVADRGEVVDVRRMGIVSLATSATGTCADGSLVCDRGVRFADGRLLPSYDWITRPVDSAASSPVRPSRTASSAR